jgi:hypothetical protein
MNYIIYTMDFMDFMDLYDIIHNKHIIKIHNINIYYTYAWFYI